MPSGALKSVFVLTALRRTRSSSPADTKPTTGEMSSDLPMFPACFQSTPLVAVWTAMSWFMRPTPITEPMSV